MNFGLSMLWFWTAYLVVTLIGVGHTWFNSIVLKMDKDTKRPVKSVYDIKSYSATVKFHTLYNIIIWPICSYFYFTMARPENLWFEAFILGLSWCVITVVWDMLAWVLI
jgi:hypothetical protein